MKAALIRTGSVPVQVPSPSVSGSPRRCLCRSGCLSGDRASTVISLNFGADRSGSDRRSVIRRALSETDVSGGIRSFPSRIPEEDEGRSRSFLLNRTATSFAGSWPDLGFSGGGSGSGSNSGRGRGGDGDGGLGNRSELGEYYEKMLKTNPGDSLLLRNYGKYLHEVVGDAARAEECYGRAILASGGGGGDGELLSLYGTLIWETQRDGERAKSYFDQAVAASPDDCTVLGSYAHFMWEAGEDEDEETNKPPEVNLSPALVPAF